MPVSNAQKKAVDKYMEKLDDIKLRVPKGKREELRKAAEAKGHDSLNAYIKALLEQDSGVSL